MLVRRTTEISIQPLSTYRPLPPHLRRDTGEFCWETTEIIHTHTEYRVHLLLAAKSTVSSTPVTLCLRSSKWRVGRMANAEPPHKRRKVRKGTQSCWECKRRKIKCTFEDSHNVTCDGCTRRGTLCVGQEHPDNSTSGSTRNYADRLGRVERLVEQLLLDTKSHARDDSVESSPPRSREVEDHADVVEKPPGVPSAPLQVSSEDEVTCSKLLSVWPDERSLKLILDIPVDSTAFLHGLICLPQTAHRGKKMASLRTMLQRPSISSHPVIIARKLLMLGSYLQTILPRGIQYLRELGVHCHEIMPRAINMANTLLHTNDECAGSLEGIECIMIESSYYNNSGHLRRAWSTLRRGLTIAQVIGLHRANAKSSMRTVEPYDGASPDRVWFRLIQFDRYLSLMLGLPQYVSESKFATADALDVCDPVERVQRIDCAAAGLMIERNEANINDSAATQEIEKLLIKSAGYVDPQWWVIPDSTPDAGDENGMSFDIDRLYDHFAHYHLLVRLHLPYLLRQPVPGDCGSKITAVNASREILSRFLVFRSFSQSQSYCRGIDFLMYLACTALCLAHMNAHRQSYESTSNTGEVVGLRYLAHQRPVDRGMMERALEYVRQMAHDSNNFIASRIANVVQHLLEIERDSAGGGSYSATASHSCEGELECDGRFSNEGNVLQIHVPSFGMIKIERGGVFRSDLNMSSTLANGVEAGMQSNAELPHPNLGMLYNEDALYQNDVPSFGCLPGFDSGDWALQGVDMALFDSIIRGSDLEFGTL